MGAPTVRELLNRLRWAGESDEEDVEIAFVVRGEDGERIESIALSQVAEIVPRGVTLSGETFIPYHRLRLVRRGGDVLWRPRRRRSDDEG